MMTRQMMTIDRFLPSTCPTAQPQQPHGKDRTPPPPPAGRTEKKQHIVNQPTRVSSDAPPKTPLQMSGRITIWEPAGTFQPTAQVRTNVASSFWHEEG